MATLVSESVLVPLVRSVLDHTVPGGMSVDDHSRSSGLVVLHSGQDQTGMVPCLGLLLPDSAVPFGNPGIWISNHCNYPVCESCPLIR